MMGTIMITKICMLSLLTAFLSIPGCLAQGALTPGSTFSQNHPRRYQVLTSDQNLQNQVNQDYGHLDGQYQNLNSQANNIWNQEQSDAYQNGGYITRNQWAQLDSQEAALQNSINSDLTAGQSYQSGNPWVDYNPGGSTNPASGPPQTSTGNMAVQGGYTGQACGWAGSGGFSGGLPPTSTSLVDLNVVY